MLVRITSLDRFTIKGVIKIIYIYIKRSSLVMELQKRSSDFGRSISQTLSGNGTVPYRPKSELVPYSDVHCNAEIRTSAGLVTRRSDFGRSGCLAWSIVQFELLYIESNKNRSVWTIVRISDRAKTSKIRTKSFGFRTNAEIQTIRQPNQFALSKR